MAYLSAMSDALHTVVETHRFVRDAKAVGLSDEERAGIVDLIAADPTQGVEIRGSGGVRKVRVAGRGKGKSGGYRVVVAFYGTDVPVYLFALLSKGERETFTAAEVAAMKAVSLAIRAAKRKG